jgi:hypothetical protein
VGLHLGFRAIIPTPPRRLSSCTVLNLTHALVCIGRRSPATTTTTSCPRTHSRSAPPLALDAWARARSGRHSRRSRRRTPTMRLRVRRRVRARAQVWRAEALSPKP